MEEDPFEDTYLPDPQQEEVVEQKDPLKEALKRKAKRLALASHAPKANFNTNRPVRNHTVRPRSR